MMVDAAYDELYRAMKPGMRENEARRLGQQGPLRSGLGICRSGQRDFRRALQSRIRMFSPIACCARAIRCYYDILHSYMGYRTCYYRTFSMGYASHAMVDAYKRCRDYLDAAIELVRPGRTTARNGLGLAEGAGIRISQRRSRLCAAIRSWHWSGHLGKTGDQPSGFA